MPKSDSSSNPNGGPSFQGPRYRPNWLAAILCFIVGTYLLAALVNYGPNQVRFNSTEPTGKNWVGWLGADTVWVLFYGIGVSAWLLVPAMYRMFYIAIRNPRQLGVPRVTAVVIGIVSMSGLLAMFESVKANDTFPKAWGGMTGQFIYKRLLSDALGPFGSGLLLGSIYCFALLFLITKDIGSDIEKIMSNFAQWRAERALRKQALAEERAKRKEDSAKMRSTAGPTMPPFPVAQPAAVGPTGAKKFVVPKGPEDPLSRPVGRPPVAVEAKPAAKEPGPKIALT